MASLHRIHSPSANKSHDLNRLARCKNPRFVLAPWDKFLVDLNGARSIAHAEVDD